MSGVARAWVIFLAVVYLALGVWLLLWRTRWVRSLWLATLITAIWAGLDEFSVKAIGAWREQTINQRQDTDLTPIGAVNGGDGFGNVAALLSAGIRMMPELAGCAWSGAWSGLRPASPGPPARFSVTGAPSVVAPDTSALFMLIVPS